MLKRIGSRLSPATVIATIALFAALGGGYAIAFKGSGTLQKGALRGIPASFTTVRSLTDVGAVQVLCEANEVTLLLVNGAGEELLLTGGGTDGPFVSSIESPGGVNFGVESGQEYLNIHVTPADGTKRPQADLDITTVETGSCETSQVTVLALNTED